MERRRCCEKNRPFWTVRTVWTDGVCVSIAEHTPTTCCAFLLDQLAEITSKPDQTLRPDGALGRV